MLGRIKAIEYECVGSTNTEAKEYAARAESFEPVLFVAREQSAGRGRLGRSFLSRRGRGIYMSLLYFTEDDLSDAVSVTTRAAVVVARAIEEVVKSPMPGNVLKINVAPGQKVNEGDVLLILEAMKMENEVVSTKTGTVAQIVVDKGAVVETDSPLVVIA